ncbi:hypothetical protein D9Q98_007185 [Chlorella vulgaris]|uniref:Uncharacterized protein n=1 Tax=Chlorella vulgaris TaxID=3077 RepID=A0A9D4YV13_CHLVU|nr:hypothetical protein D9Q98_007185 [Chlorella vulgaris]
MLRQRAVRHQQRAASREQVQHYKKRLSAELAEAQQRAAALAEQQRLEEVSRWVAEAAAQRERQRLAQLTAARACAAQQAKREAKARWLQAAEAAAQERHVAALAAKRQAVEQLATEELEKLNRQKRVSLLQAQRSRAAAVIYTRQQTTLAAVQRVNVQRAREAHARAAAPGSLAGCGGRDRIDYRLTRIHDTAGQQQAAATAASKPFSIVRYGDYLHQLQARGTLDADSNQRCYQWCG